MQKAEAYFICLELAAQNSWKRLYNKLMHEGFLKDFDYVNLYRHWKKEVDREINKHALHR